MFVPATPAKGFDVCVVGSANLDLVATTTRIPQPGETVLGSDYAEHAGGKGLNQAVAASRSGARTAFVGAIGTDAAGDHLRRVLADDRIDISRLNVVERPTGRALIIVDQDGENTIVVIPGANATVEAPEVLPQSVVVLAQLEIPIDVVESVFSTARRTGSITVLNPAPAVQLSPALIALCNLVVPNQHELEQLGGAEALLGTGCGTVVVTRGGAGVDVVSREGTRHIPAFDVDPIDTTGAGDAFCGSLSARLAAGDDLYDAVRWAAAAGALATTVRGAVPAQPTAAAIRLLLGMA